MTKEGQTILSPSQMIFNSILHCLLVSCDCECECEYASRNSSLYKSTTVVLDLVFDPLQGALNILVYTPCPHVAKGLSRNSNVSWWGAFKKVIKSGGDDGDERTNQLRRGSEVHVPVPC